MIIEESSYQPVERIYKMILTVTLNPAVDKTMEINNFQTGAVNRVVSMRTDPGGKGINVSKVIKSLGGESKALGILGGRSGSFIKSCLDSNAIENEFHFIDGETRTNIKIVDAERYANTDINEAGPEISQEDVERVERLILKNINKSSVVVFSGSVPAGVDPTIYGRWIEICKGVGSRTILDADGELLCYGIKSGPYLIKPNIHELERLFNKRIESISEAEALGKTLLKEYGIEIVVISLGKEGALYIKEGGGSLFAHTISVDVKSTVGAGDAMVAALAYSIDKGYALEKALTLSMASSIANVMTSGSQAAEKSVIMELENQIRFEYSSSIL